MKIRDKIKCIEITTPGGPDVLKLTSRTMPTCKDDEVLIKVKAAGINRPDCIQRKGNYDPPPGVTDIPGLEVSGEIISLGTEVTKFVKGDQITALVSGGGYSEYAVAPATQCLPMPKNLNFIEAAALPETFFTVWNNLFYYAHIKKGESLLIHGGSSGIGTTAIQLAKQLGIRVIATAGSDEKCNACYKLGAEKVVNYKKEDFVIAAKNFDTKGVNVILDMVGGDYIARNIKSLAPDGRLVNIAFLAGSKVTIDFMPIMLKRLTLTGSTLRPQSKARKQDIAQSLLTQIWPLIENEKIMPLIYETFPLCDASKAHKLMESNQHIGKIVLEIN